MEKIIKWAICIMLVIAVLVSIYYFYESYSKVETITDGTLV